MRNNVRQYSLPKWRLTRWLVDAGPDVPRDIRVALVESLFGTLPIFAGGVVNTILVSTVIAARIPAPPFLLWLALEIILCVTRLAVLIVARRSASQGRPTPTDLYIVLAVLWASSVGYGALISMMSGDWVSATLACLSAGAMVGGICFRNFAAPRLASVMIVLSLGPCCIGAALSSEPILLVILIQIPFYLISMSTASYRLKGMLVDTMRAERENDRRARHDELTGLFNRAGLISVIDARGIAANQPQVRWALLYLDLDGFKAVNDRYGHTIGDRLLVSVAGRIQGFIGAQEIAARIGGDEFVFLGPDTDNRDMLETADRLIEAIAAPYNLSEDIVAWVGVSIGIAYMPDHGATAQTLLEAADRALYEAKAKGKGCYAIAPLPEWPREQALSAT